MYYPNTIEKICYDEKHIEGVVEEIKVNFPSYFERCIEFEEGSEISLLAGQTEKTAEVGCGSAVKMKVRNIRQILTEIMTKGIEKFNRGRLGYLELLNIEALEEFEDSPAVFKSALWRECRIIQKSLMSKSKELDKFQRDFNLANPNDLLTVCRNISTFSSWYTEEFNDVDYDSLKGLASLKLSKLDTEEYTVVRVLGGGIKSQFLHKLQPSYFPYRSKEAIWALWYLTNQKDFDCKEKSQFLMISKEKSAITQNYFYPYELFGYYAYQVYLLLKKEVFNAK
ncbi:hypothetical protein [Ectobacillus ponti]|uniref:Uncharacterized protein n=1 Tax=Ectobacillus ponti TaxID=2961894 RepID=A0AA41X382_9BACI|nr:hypothetical protein [Ectobacillus ponti]MCP8968121.1 hypothetical protein [Ectobacillus ponti]